MTLKQRALVDVLKMLAVGAAAGVSIALSGIYIGQIPTMIVVAVLAMSYLCKLAYDMRVSQLEFEQQRIERALKEGK